LISRSVCTRTAAPAALFALLLLAAPGRAAGDRLTAEPFAPLALLYGSGAPTAAPAAGLAPAGVAALAAVPATAAPMGASELSERMAFSSSRSEDPVSGAPRSGQKALLLSLLLPGAGELYLGHRGRATGFFISEGAIWANYIAWEVAGHLRRDNYIEQAQLGAGVGVSGGTDGYWRLVGQYQSSSGTGSGAYEEELRREARTQYPNDPAQQDLYVAQRLPTGKQAWMWTSPDLQAEYLRTRKNANLAFDRAKYSFGLAVLNRLLSALDTQILHHSDRAADRQSRADEGGVLILTKTTADGGGALLIQRRF
jgi:hypothetical protein